MTPKRPPVLAAWLFEHFACGPNTVVVLGDLAERYVHKGRMWYWRQVLKGILVSVVAEALGHKAIVARALVTGCLAWVVFLAIYTNVVFGSAAHSGPRFDLFGYLAHPLGVWAALWMPVAATLSLPGKSAVVQLWIQFALPLVAWAACGWIVTRVDRGRTHRDLAPLFAGFVLLLNLVFVVPGLTGFLADVRRGPLGPSGTVFRISTADLIALTGANAVMSVFGILLGGSLRMTRGADTTVMTSRR
jgi:hypothetical protein